MRNWRPRQPFFVKCCENGTKFEAEKYLTELETLAVSKDRDLLKFERPRIAQLASDACLPEALNERAARLLSVWIARTMRPGASVLHHAASENHTPTGRTPPEEEKLRREACFFVEGPAAVTHHTVIYLPTVLVVMALRNASGEVTVEMICVPSPTP